MHVGGGLQEVIESDAADDGDEQHTSGDVPHAPERRGVDSVEQVLRGKKPGLPGRGRRTTRLVFLHSGFDWLPERRFGVHLHCGPAWIPLRPTAYGAWLPEHQLSKCLLPGVSDRSMTGRVGSTAALVYLRLTTIEKPD